MMLPAGIAESAQSLFTVMRTISEPARASAARHPSRTHRTATALADRSPDPYIDQIALDFPELSIVCGHIGYPRTEEMIAVARKHPGVYIDTSAYPTKRQPAELVST